VESLSAETLLKLECLITHLGGVDHVEPHHELNDSSVCTFMTFVLREVLTYLGLLPSKEPVYCTEFKICTLKQTLYQDFAIQLKTILDQ